MDQLEEVATSSFCLACLSTNCVEPYVVQNEALRTVFTIDVIQLCYLCRKIARHTELFIMNVQNNQMWLGNLQKVTTNILETLQSQSQPPVNLSYLPPSVISINNTTSSDMSCEEFNAEEPVFTVYSSQSPSVKVEVKMEFEGEMMDEDEFPLQDLASDPTIKEEYEDEQSIFTITKGKKGRRKKKGWTTKKSKKVKLEKSQDKNDIKVETIHITREQCLDELVKKSLDKDYLNAAYKCDDCVKGYANKGAYDKHMELHAKSNGSLVCNICLQRFGSRSKLKDHLKNHTLRYRCTVCGIANTNRVGMRDHYAAVHRDQELVPYKCTQCPKEFKRGVSLRRHILYNHAQRSRVQCAHCGKTYACKDILKTHMLMRHPSEISSGAPVKRNVCPECGKCFSAPSILEKHMVKHSQRKDYYCVECNKSFKSEYILKTHLKTTMTHAKYSDLPLECAHCEKRFAIKRDLVQHMNRVHLNIKPFACDQCDRAYVNAHSLKVHQRLAHEGYKRPLKFPCSMCDKIFDRNCILKSHIRTHTGERPYQCSECSATFTQSSVLGTHYKLVHLKLTRDGRPKNSSALKR